MQDLSVIAASFLTLASAPRTGTLLLVLAIATAIDMRYHRVPNVLTAAGMLLGLVMNTIGEPGLAAGLLRAFGGLVAGMAALLPLGALRMLDAGDMKLMGVVGAFLGLPDLLPALLFVLATAGFVGMARVVLGGTTRRLAANAVLLVRAAWGSLRAGGRPNAAPGGATTRLPYALSIFIGTVTFLLIQRASGG